MKIVEFKKNIESNDQFIKEHFYICSQSWQNKITRTHYSGKIECDYALLKEGDFENKIVLNEGCGFPIDEILFSPYAEKWITVDFSQEIIKRVNEIIKVFNLKNVEINYGDIRQLQYPNNCFDIILSFSTIDHIWDENERLKTFKEANRVLKPGGIFIISVPVSDKSCFIQLSEHPGSKYYSFERNEIKYLCLINNFIIEKTCEYNTRFGLRCRKKS